MEVCQTSFISRWPVEFGGWIRELVRRVVPVPLRPLPRKLGGHVLDRFYGIRTEGWYCLSPNDKSAAKYGDGIEYQTCPYVALWAVLRRLPIGQEDVLYDLGCGKGRAICVFAKSGRFRKCVGIELVPMLADAARQNVSKLRDHCAVEIVTGDAATADLSDGTVFFLFNPFGVKTLSAVLRNIGNVRNGRRVWVVCFGLHQEELYDTCPWLERYSSSGRVGIWRSRPDQG